jgi:hypothetical protein
MATTQQSSKIGSIFADTHQLWNTIQTLDSDQIKIVSKLLGASQETRSVISYYTGFLDGVNMERWNVCPTCQEDHEDGDMSFFEKLIIKKAGSGVEELKPVAEEVQKNTDEDHRVGTYL